MGPDRTFLAARALAESQGARHLVVVEGQRILGVVEEDGLWLAPEDILRTAAGLQRSLTARDSRAVRSAMRPAVCVSPNESLEIAARVMLLKHRTAVPVVADGRLIGVLTVDDCRQAVGAPLAAVPPPEHAGHHSDESPTRPPREGAHVA